MTRKRKTALLAALLLVLFAVATFVFRVGLRRTPEREEIAPIGPSVVDSLGFLATEVPRETPVRPEPEAVPEGPGPAGRPPVELFPPTAQPPTVGAGRPAAPRPGPPEPTAPAMPAEPPTVAMPAEPPTVAMPAEPPTVAMPAEPPTVAMPAEPPEPPTVAMPAEPPEPPTATMPAEPSTVTMPQPPPAAAPTEIATLPPTPEDFESFVVQRIPRSTFRSIGESDQLASRDLPAVGIEPTDDSFSVRDVPVSDFPAALMTHRRIRERKGLASRTRPIPADPAGSSPFRWDQLELRTSSTLDRPRNGPDTHVGRHGLSLVRLLPQGRLDVEVEAGDSNGRTYLSRGYLGIRTHRGWSAAIGDQRVGYSSPGLRGTTARGVRIERTRSLAGSPTRWAAGALAGRAAVDYANVERGVFPRSLETAFVRIEKPRRQSAEAVVYHLADRELSSAPAADNLQDAYGVGISGSLLRQGLDLRGELVSSSARLEDGTRQDGQAIDVRGRGGAERLSFSGRLQGSRGEAFEVGHYGTREITPREIQEGTVDLRTGGGTSVSGWAGRWEYPLSFLADTTFSDPRRRSVRGDRWGGRATWRSRRTGSGWSGSAEERHRTLTDGSERVVTLASSISQEIRRRLRASLGWNRLDYSNRPARTYLTGSASLRLGRTGSFTLRQRTFWQEPLGPRLESIADLSSMRALDGRVVWSSQLALTHEEKEGGGFRRIQTLGRIGADLRLDRDVRLRGRYQLNHSPGGDVHSFDLTLTHSFGGTTFGPPTLGLEQIPYERQIVTGRVFDDRNRDGLRQEDEPGVPGVEVAIDRDSREPVVTDVDGVYRCFLFHGRHELRLLPASVPTTYALEGAGPAEVEVLPDRMTTHDFPLVRRVASISGTVFDDRRGMVMADVKVRLGPGRFTFTDENGAFRFDALPVGDYELRLDVESLPFGYRPVGTGARRFRLEEATASRRYTLHVTRPVASVRF